MTTYITFLRAINVAGHAVVKMDALRDAFTAAGCRNVRTYIQSGNVIFDLPARGDAEVLQSLRGELRSLLGAEPEIFLRTLDELVQLVRRDPFQDFQAQPDVKLYVALLAAKPRVRPRFPLLLPKEGLEAFAIDGPGSVHCQPPQPEGLLWLPQ